MNTPIEIAIRQAEASVKYLESLLKCNRCRADELVTAKAKLVELRGMLGVQVERRTSPQPPSAIPHVGYAQGGVGTTAPVSDNVLSMKATLMREIDSLARAQAELSNRLHTFREGEPTGLVGRVILIRGQIESLWTKYRYLEANGVLPEEATEESDAKSFALLEAEDRRKKLGEKRSKLNKKIDDPLNARKAGKLEEWRIEKVAVDAELQELDIRIALLRNQ